MTEKNQMTNLPTPSVVFPYIWLRYEISNARCRRGVYATKIGVSMVIYNHHKLTSHLRLVAKIAMGYRLWIAS